MPTPSTTGVNPDEELSRVADLADHLQTVNLYANTFPNALSMITELEDATAKLRAFFEAGGYGR